ncbi:(Fe-S)-binding protein [Neiella marina]|uniref:(Fe-S)-binding protein n=1 Tax=Neiella marina TaxID=508461 RepID=UPI000B3C8BF4|nr:(Fe-S)-binding protein [Neiella marina]
MKRLLDWSQYQDQGMGDAYADIPNHGGDFAKAVSVCIRSGICQESNNRRLMCPSFRISDDANLSPGGRVQLLKKLLNDSDNSFLTDRQLAASLEQCVSCKGCKRECENNLDMAAIKAEYLAQRRELGLSSLRSRLFAEFPYWLYRFAWLNNLIKWRNQSSVLKTIGASLVGINSNIDLPEPALTPYQDSPAQQARNEAWSGKADPMTVVLLIDSFTALFHPNHATDAIDVLTAAGYKVITIHPQTNASGELLDSGRSLFSQGFIDRAKQQGRALLAALSPFLAAQIKIVGLEPSAHLMLRDEYLMMQLGPEVQGLAQHSLLFEEFVAREKMAGRFNADFQPAACGTVLVHGHCHQKAVGAIKSMRKVLRLIPKLKVNFIEASCCGMAGSYGLQNEHAESSLAMANMALLPALDDMPQAPVVCNGFSCSHQIYALRGRKPFHLATLLAGHLKKPAKTPAHQ